MCIKSGLILAIGSLVAICGCSRRPSSPTPPFPEVTILNDSGTPAKITPIVITGKPPFATVNEQVPASTLTQGKGLITNSTMVMEGWHESRSCGLLIQGRYVDGYAVLPPQTIRNGQKPHIIRINQFTVEWHMGKEMLIVLSGGDRSIR